MKKSQQHRKTKTASSLAKTREQEAFKCLAVMFWFEISWILELRVWSCWYKNFNAWCVVNT
jgi:hypothetical protein